MKTVIAPALRQRALHVDGWFSTNILGNRDGLALDDPASLKSKLGTKKSVLDQMLGYPVEDHIIVLWPNGVSLRPGQRFAPARRQTSSWKRASRPLSPQPGSVTWMQGSFVNSVSTKPHRR